MATRTTTGGGTARAEFNDEAHAVLDAVEADEIDEAEATRRLRRLLRLDE